jgi:long-subunit acyl-CoA synthetase (AMP-forming)
VHAVCDFRCLRYKLANGKYVVPTPIENCMAGARHLQQVFVCVAPSSLIMFL